MQFVLPMGMNAGFLLLAALVLVTLDDGEGTRVLVVLHHEPNAVVSEIDRYSATH